MRVAICVRHEHTIFRLVWINESKAGIYIGTLGTAKDSHESYHQDGIRHTKIGADYHNRFSDTPIAAHTGLKQLGHYSLSLTKNWFNSKTIYTGDYKTESIILIDQRLLCGKDTLALNIWLADRKSEQQLLEQMARGYEIQQFRPVAEIVTALQHFPNHKVALSLSSAKIREVAANELMFPAENA